MKNTIRHNTGQWHKDIIRIHNITYRNGRKATAVVLTGSDECGNSTVEYGDGEIEANVNVAICPEVKRLPTMSQLLRDGWAALTKGSKVLKPTFVNNYGGDLSDPYGGDLAFKTC